MSRLRSEANQQQMIAWRREKILDLNSKGYNGREIAKVLHISHPTIDRDVQYLRRQYAGQI